MRNDLKSDFSSRFPLRFDMVHHNPGEPLIDSAFTDPFFLASTGYNGMVVNDFVFIHTAITYETLNPEILPEGSAERQWVDQQGARIDTMINRCKKAGIQCFYFTDIIVIPKRLKEIYHEDICDDDGLIDMRKPMTQKVHRVMLREIFQRFPGLDGLVIRCGETYLHNVPHHTGNGPKVNGKEDFYDILLNILREEVCDELDRKVFFRTWGFDGFHSDPANYLSITDKIKPHKNLFFSIKHTMLDFWRTIPFNPTLGIGKHKQIVEVQCQREYEGKGAFPNYVVNGVVDGFEETMSEKEPCCLNNLLDNNLLQGIWTWSRGGGWVGPYIRDEFWCRLNALVMVAWANDPLKSEEQCFNEVASKMGFVQADISNLRQICLLSAKAILLGHYFNKFPFPPPSEPNPVFHYINWTRDEFLGGLDILEPVFRHYCLNGNLEGLLQEKKEAAAMWHRIVSLSDEFHSTHDSSVKEYIKVSARYGKYLHDIIYHAWQIMGLGVCDELTGSNHKVQITASRLAYDEVFAEYLKFPMQSSLCATLYKPYSWEYAPPHYHGDNGMQLSVQKYR